MRAYCLWSIMVDLKGLIILLLLLLLLKGLVILDFVDKFCMWNVHLLGFAALAMIVTGLKRINYKHIVK